MLTCPALRRKRDQPRRCPLPVLLPQLDTLRFESQGSLRHLFERHLSLFPELRSLHLSRVDFDKSNAKYFGKYCKNERWTESGYPGS